MSRSLEQKRAMYAMEFIDKWKGKPSKERDKMVTLVQKAPVQILQNGLGQTLAFLLADNEGNTDDKRKPSGHLYDCLQEWICGGQNESWPCRVYGGSQFIKQLMDGDRGQYLRAEQEALALLDWLKKFAVANLK